MFSQTTHSKSLLAVDQSVMIKGKRSDRMFGLVSVLPVTGSLILTKLRLCHQTGT